MPTVHPFRPLVFARHGTDLSAVVAPPYDVLDLPGKNRLLAAHPDNIVGIDLPHVPAKELGPPEAYKTAGERFAQAITAGTLTRRHAPAFFAYRQTFQFQGTTHQRCGMFCTLEVQPFGPRPGGGILPHEETFSGPKQDRLALMHATQAQLSPIFGLHADELGRATTIVRSVMHRAPDQTARMAHDNVLHEVWAIEDADTIRAYQDALAGEDIFIADGHHRYNTALNYLRELESKGPVPADHPARRCMFVLIGMSDPGLVIGPTHRVLGGMESYTLDAFLTASSSHLVCEPVAGNLHALHAEINAPGTEGQTRLGLHDVASRRNFLCTLPTADPLASRFASKPIEWRTLDVAIVQHWIVEELCQPKLNAGKPVTWAFPHTVDEVADICSGTQTGAGGGKGFTPQLAILVRPTPLAAVRAVSKANELMPQKSTFFYPKLATGLYINPLK